MRDGEKDKKELIEEVSRLRLQIDSLRKDMSLSNLEDNVFRIIADSVQAGIYIVQNGRTVFTNAHISSYSGYSEEELLKLSLISDTVHPEDQIRVRAAGIGMLKGRDPTPYEYRILCKDGSVRWLLEKVVSIMYQGKRAVLGNTIDITEKKRTEAELVQLTERLSMQVEERTAALLKANEALRESEVRYRSIYENMLVGIYHSTPEGRFIRVNPAMAAMCGYDSPQEMIDAISDISREYYADPVERERFSGLLKAHGRIDNIEYQVRRKDGSKIWVAVNARSVSDDQGGILYYEGTCRDITEQIRMQDHLRESEEVFRLLFEKSGDANLITDGVRYVDCNESALRIAGFSDKSQLLGLTPEDISPYRQPDGELSSEKAKKMINLAFAEGSNRFEWVRKRPDGTELYLDVMLTSIQVKGKRLLYTTWRDISERKKADDELRESRQRLAHIIDFLPDATFVIDKGGCVIAWNRAIEEMTGIGASKMLGRGNYEYALPFYGVRRPILIDLVFQTEEDIEKRYLFVQRSEDGSLLAEADVSTESRPCILWGIASPLYDSKGALTGAIESIRDITERKKVEQALRESERQLATIIDFLPDATMVIDREGKVIAWNRAMEDMTGVDSKDMIGKGNYEHGVPFYGVRRPTLIDLVLNPDEELEKQYTTFERRGEILFGESYTPALQGSRGAHLSATASILRNSKGEIIGAIECIRDNTERKKIGEDLRRSEKKYRDLVDNTPVGVYQASADGRILFANQAYADIFGYESANAMIGVNAVTLYKDWNDRRKFLESLQQYGRVLNYEIEVLSKSGETKFILTSCVLEENLVSGTIIDITRRKQAEKALHEGERRLSDIINFLPDATMVIDREGRVIAWNRAIEALTGFMAVDILGKGDYEYAIPFYGVKRPILIDLVFEPREGLENKYEGIKRQDDLIIGEAYIHNLQGRKAYLLGTAAPLYDTRGAIVGAIESIRDITERRRMEEALSQEHDRLVAILDRIPISAFVIDRDRTVVLWNRSSEIFMGKSKEDVMGRELDISHLFKGKAHPSLAELLLNMTDDEVMTKFGHRGILKNAQFSGRFESTGRIWPDGEERIVSIQAARIFDPAGKVAGAVQTVQDITERVHLETQFHQAQKMEAIGTLAGGIAHDFNNILAAIIGYTELSLDEHDPISRRRKLSEVLNASSRAKNLVKQILTFSRHTDYEKKPVDLRPIAKEALKLIRSTFPTTIEIRQKITNASCTINADITQMHQIIMNLCTNAAQAMGEKGGILTVDLSQADLRVEKLPGHSDFRPGFYIKLSVADTGPGIDPAVEERIFEPFFTTKATGEGTGLGLSVVYGIVKNHDGMIYVTSESGKGAIFDVYLPSIEKEDTEMEIAGEETISRGHEHILYADDDKILLDLARMILESLGYKVTAGTSSVEVLKMFIADPAQFDLVITDMTMPTMPGSELAREIMKIRSDIPIILCTGFSEYIDETRAKVLGIRAFIMKPFAKKDLGRIVRDVLDGRV